MSRSAAREFANPNGTEPDPSGALGRTVTATVLSAVVPPELRLASYQIRVIGLTANFLTGGGDAHTLRPRGGDVACFGIWHSSGRPRTARRIGRMALALTGLVGVVLPAVCGGQPVTRHSGRVERVDIDGGLVLVSELAARGRARQHAFVVKPDTAIVSSARLRSWQSHDEVAVSLVDLLSGDFVVVDSVTDGARMVALRITIVEPRAAGRRAP